MHFDVAESLIPVESHHQGRQRRGPKAGGNYWAGTGSLENHPGDNTVEGSHRVDQTDTSRTEGGRGCGNSKLRAALGNDVS